MTWLPGDLLFFTGPWSDRTAAIIRLATARPLRIVGPWFGPSHVGGIIIDDGRPRLIESTTLSQHPCLINGVCTSGAQAHVPEERIIEYLQAGGKVAVYRLANDRQLDEYQSERLRRTATKFVTAEVQYDLRGAILSGTRWLRWFAPHADAHSLFCSEMWGRWLADLNCIDNGGSGWMSPYALLRRVLENGVYELRQTWRARDLHLFVGSGE